MKQYLWLLIFFCTACSHSIHLVDIHGFDLQPAEEKSHLIAAQAEQKVILGFVFDTQYVDEAHQKLLSQCKGAIRAVSTQFSTSHGFMHWTNKIKMQGLCVEP